MPRGTVLLLLFWIANMAQTNVSGADAFATRNSAGGTEAPKLPPPDPNASGDIPTIKLGETIRFEEWGPIILNSDGTTRRIDNWDQLTAKEKEVSWRRISKRNEERRKILLEQQQQQQDAADEKDNEESHEL